MHICLRYGILIIDHQNIYIKNLTLQNILAYVKLYIVVIKKTRNHEKMKGGKFMDNILLKVRVQVIYYQTRKNDLGISYATSDKRITIAEAEDILVDREVEFEEVLKVKYEYVDLEVPLDDFENYLVEI